MANAVTPEELARRKADVIERLGRNQNLTISHFKNIGYQWKWLKSLEADGIKFGRPVRNTLTLNNREK